MEDKLDFSLPNKKQKNSFAPGVVIILLLILIGLTIANLLVRPLRQGHYLANAVSSPSPDQVKELAVKLAGRNLYARAAKVWQEYLSVSKIPDAERAKTLFQIGNLLEKVGSYDEAIEYYYRSEATAKIDELEPQINANIKNCFEKIGNFSALRYELMSRAESRR